MFEHVCKTKVSTFFVPPRFDCDVCSLQVYDFKLSEPEYAELRETAG